MEVDYNSSVKDWATHPQRTQIEAELRQNIRDLQNEVFDDIKVGNVPQTNEGTSNGFGRIN
jgi:hypothetical protein